MDEFDIGVDGVSLYRMNDRGDGEEEDDKEEEVEGLECCHI